MASPHVVELTQDNWDQEVVRSNQPVLVDFWSPTCGPCRMLAPIIDRLGEQYAGRVKVGKVNVDDDLDLARRYRIDAIPQLFLFNGGSDPVDQRLGLTPQQEIAEMIERTLNSPRAS